MSAYSILDISRTRAKEYVLGKIYTKINDDNFLEKLMDELLRDRLYNCRIVNDDSENDDTRL